MKTFKACKELLKLQVKYQEIQIQKYKELCDSLQERIVELETLREYIETTEFKNRNKGE